VTPPTPLPPRYGRLRLDGGLDEFHHALNALKADTCERGRCDPDGSAECTKHERRRLRPLRPRPSDGEASGL